MYVWQEAIQLDRRSGLFLVAGPSNSGRTTTINALMHYMAKTQSRNIVSFETTCEGQFENYPTSLISRRLYGIDILDLNSFLEAVCKEDTDVLVLNEIDQPELMDAAIQMSNRGLLVIGQLNATDIENCLQRIFLTTIDSPEKRALLSNSLLGILHQHFFTNKIKERVFLQETLGVYQPIRKAIREGMIAPIQAFMKSSGKKDCVAYQRGFENLVATYKIEPDEIPAKYR